VEAPRVDPWLLLSLAFAGVRAATWRSSSAPAAAAEANPAATPAAEAARRIAMGAL
jgi:hypothetical protein